MGELVGVRSTIEGGSGEPHESRYHAMGIDACSFVKNDGMYPARKIDDNLFRILSLWGCWV